MSTFSKKCLRSPLSLSLGPDYQVHIQVVNSVWTVSFTCTALHDFSFYPFHSIKERPIRRTTKKQKSFLLVCTAPCFCFHFSCIYQSNKSMLCFILFFFYRLWHLLSFIAKKKKKKNQTGILQLRQTDFQVIENHSRLYVHTCYFSTTEKTQTKLYLIY